MSSRTGLLALVPPLELCQRMDAVPDLREAFKDTYAVWYCIWLDRHHWKSSWRVGVRTECLRMPVIAAPTVQELGRWLARDPLAVPEPPKEKTYPAVNKIDVDIHAPCDAALREQRRQAKEAGR